jgi:hypothetical protein
VANSKNVRGSNRRAASAERTAELRSARRRAVAAKTCLATLGAVTFGAAMVFAQHSYAGHAKEPATALEAPPRFVKVVKEDLLQAGVVGPAQAPPDAATAAS